MTDLNKNRTSCKNWSSTQLSEEVNKKFQLKFQKLFQNETDERPYISHLQNQSTDEDYFLCITIVSSSVEIKTLRYAAINISVEFLLRIHFGFGSFFFLLPFLTARKRIDSGVFRKESNRAMAPVSPK